VRTNNKLRELAVTRVDDDAFEADELLLKARGEPRQF
jgi:hypothetical protein